MVSITEVAAEKLKKSISEQKNPESTMLRIAFGGYGWGGPQLQLTLDELKDDEDSIVESQGIKIVYSSGLESYVTNAVIDYSNSWYERGFVIKGSGTSSCC